MRRSLLLLSLLSTAWLPVMAVAKDAQPSIAVHGEAEVRVVPDRAILPVAVEVDADSADGAADAAHRKARAFVAAAEALGAGDKDIRSMAVSVSPRYRWDEKRREQLQVGFRARRDIMVEVRDLARLGDFIQEAQRHGMTHIGSPQLEASNAREHQREALRLAAADAKANAAAIAGGLSLNLGRLLSISDEQQMQRPPQPMAMRMAADIAESSSPDLGLRSGEIVFDARLRARFAVGN